MVSIWIVNDEIPEDLQGTASRYYFTKEDFIGETDEPKSEYDLMEVVMIRRGDHQDLTKPVFAYLKSVYDANIEEIDKYTPASANAKLKKEVSEMPGMSQVIYEEGIKKGIKEGIKEGIETGERSKALQVYANCINRGMSKEDALAISGLSEKEV